MSEKKPETRRFSTIDAFYLTGKSLFFLLSLAEAIICIACIIYSLHFFSVFMPSLEYYAYSLKGMWAGGIDYSGFLDFNYSKTVIIFILKFFFYLVTTGLSVIFFIFPAFRLYELVAKSFIATKGLIKT